MRYYKTRNIATEACKKGHVRISGEIAKASKEVFPQDKIQVRKGAITYEIEVLDIPTSRVGAKLVGLYCIDHTPEEAFEQEELRQLSQEYYRKKGEGRPTKKDRRDLDDFFSSEEEEEWGSEQWKVKSEEWRVKSEKWKVKSEKWLFHISMRAFGFCCRGDLQIALCRHMRGVKSVAKRMSLGMWWKMKENQR